MPSIFWGACRNVRDFEVLCNAYGQGKLPPLEGDTTRFRPGSILVSSKPFDFFDDGIPWDCARMVQCPRLFNGVAACAGLMVIDPDERFCKIFLTVYTLDKRLFLVVSRLTPRRCESTTDPRPPCSAQLVSTCLAPMLSSEPPRERALASMEPDLVPSYAREPGSSAKAKLDKIMNI
jgi:hypothetical protein